MDNNKPSNNSFLPLPADPGGNAAADLVRKKVEAAYKNEPNAVSEGLDIEELGTAIAHSKHQQFLHGLINSGKSAAEIQAAWHEYYAGLTDVEKHEIWQEFYATHAEASRYGAPSPVLAPAPMKVIEPPQVVASRPIATTPLQKISSSRTISDMKKYVSAGVAKRPAFKPNRHVQSLLFGLSAGAIVILILLFSFFNERFIAPLIQPSRNVSNIPLIDSSAAVGVNPEIIIPKINVQIPVVYGIRSIDETAVNAGLENGVVHYADTALPGQNGNVAIVGHSSNNIFNKGKYKFAFVLLSQLETGDTLYLQKDGKRYTYQVYKKEIVKPDNVSVLGPPSDKPAVVTLITCDPPGTSINRLIVVGEQIDPNPIANSPRVTDNALATQTKVIPSNAPTLWSRLWGWFSR